MRFARVQGHGRKISANDQTIVSIVVTLDDGRHVRLVRDERVPWLQFGPEGDTAGQIDQYSQETLGGMLANEGWEVVSQDQSANVTDDDGISHSSLFVARKAGWR